MRHFLPACALIAAVSAAPPVADAIKFQPKTGSSWTRIHETKVDLEWEAMQVRIDDEALEQDETKVRWNARNAVEVQDTIHAWDPLGKRSFDRDYIRVERDVNAPVSMVIGDRKIESELTAQGFGELMGQRVLFEKVPETQEWSRRFDEDVQEGNAPRKVPALQADFDFQCLVPPRTMKPGKSWNIPADEFVRALAGHHGMQMHMETNASDELPVWLGALSDQPQWGELLSNASKAKVTATLKPRVRAGGLMISPIEISVRIPGEADLTDWAMQAFEAMSSEDSEVLVNSASQNTLLTGSAMAYWDLEARRLHSLDFFGEARFTRWQDLNIQTGATTEENALRVELEADGQFQCEVHVSTRPNR